MGNACASRRFLRHHKGKFLGWVAVIVGLCCFSRPSLGYDIDIEGASQVNIMAWGDGGGTVELEVLSELYRALPGVGVQLMVRRHAGEAVLQLQGMTDGEGKWRRDLALSPGRYQLEASVDPQPYMRSGHASYLLNVTGCRAGLSWALGGVTFWPSRAGLVLQVSRGESCPTKNVSLMANLPPLESQRTDIAGAGNAAIFTFDTTKLHPDTYLLSVKVLNDMDFFPESLETKLVVFEIWFSPEFGLARHWRGLYGWAKVMEGMCDGGGCEGLIAWMEIPDTEGMPQRYRGISDAAGNYRFDGIDLPSGTCEMVRLWRDDVVGESAAISRELCVPPKGAYVRILGMVGGGLLLSCLVMLAIRRRKPRLVTLPPAPPKFWPKPSLSAAAVPLQRQDRAMLQSQRDYVIQCFNAVATHLCQQSIPWGSRTPAALIKRYAAQVDAKKNAELQHFFDLAQEALFSPGFIDPAKAEEIYTLASRLVGK